MEIKLQRIQKIAGIANIVCRVLFVMCIVGACLTVAGVVSYFAIGDLNLKFGDVTLGGILSETDGLTKPQIICEFISAFIQCVVGAVLFGFSKEFLKNELADGTPFTEKSSKCVLKIGILTCVLPFAGEMVTSAIAAAVKAETEFDSHPDILAGLLLILISLLLSYGSELVNRNKESESQSVSEKEN